jgi:disulfide bond formation protein DsbB
LTERLEFFFAALALVVIVVTVVTRVAWVLGHRVLEAVAPYRYRIAAAVAVTSMLGSLYFSEVANFEPCTLCWYQRIAMYSLAVILVVASFRNDHIRVYGVVLAGLGATVSGYHWLLERIPAVDAGVCSTTVPCEFIWFEKFGFVTLPFMAFAGFVAILNVLILPVDRPTDARSTDTSRSA